MSINRQMARGAGWTVGLRMFHRAFGFISTLILARLLVPEDFGLVAMATVFLHLLNAVTEFSIHIPLIQKAQIDRADMDSAWSFQIAIGTLQAALLAALAGPAAALYDDPRLIPIIHSLAIIALLKGAKNIGVVMFQREMAFNRDFTLMASQRVAMFVVTVGAAVIWRSYWALVGGMVAGAIVELVLSYVMHSFRPRPSVERWLELFNFSKWLLVRNVLVFIGQRAPDFFLGRLIGARAVGLFSMSYDIAMLPSSELVAPINRVALPGYSRLRETEGGLAKGYLEVAGLIALISLPAAVGISATAEVLIPVLLGQKWLDAIPVVQLLAMSGALGVLHTNAGAVIMALGRPALTTVQAAVRVFLLVPGILLGANVAGVTGVAAAYLLVGVVMLVVNVAIVLHLLALPVTQYIKVVYRPSVAVAVMYAGLVLVVLPWQARVSWAGLALSALIAVIAGAGLFILVMLALWSLAGRPQGAESRFIQILSEILIGRAPKVGRWLQKQI